MQVGPNRLAIQLQISTNHQARIWAIKEDAEEDVAQQTHPLWPEPARQGYDSLNQRRT